MKKPILFWLLTTVLLGANCPAHAQQPKKISRLGYIAAGDKANESPRVNALRMALGKLGYTEGQNIITEYHYADGKEDYSTLVTELVSLKPDLIVIGGGTTSFGRW